MQLHATTTTQATTDQRQQHHRAVRQSDHRGPIENRIPPPYRDGGIDRPRRPGPSRSRLRRERIGADERAGGGERQGGAEIAGERTAEPGDHLGELYNIFVYVKNFEIFIFLSFFSNFQYIFNFSNFFCDL